MASPVSHPLISVIVPAYNVGEKLEETLRSLAGQGPKDDSRFEFLIVDDGSRDNTLEVAKAFAATDPRFKVLHQRNRGCGPARNTGLDAAAGDWVGFLDGDDILMPGTLDKVLNRTSTGSSGATPNSRIIGTGLRLRRRPRG